MVTTRPVVLKHVGVDLARMLARDEPVVPGIDTPRGIEMLDLSWYADRLTVDRLAECDDAGLAAMRVEARQYCELRRMQELARGGPQQGGAA